MILAVTPGDPEGIGPEVAWKAIQELHRNPGLLGSGPAPKILCIGARKPFDRLKVPIVETSVAEVLAGQAAPKKDAKPLVWLIPAPEKAPRSRFLPGYQSGWSIETAVALQKSQAVAALATGPINKDRLNRGGYLYPGHTEFLADLCGLKDRDVTMMLANERLRVTLVTIHMGVAKVARSITSRDIIRTATRTTEHLRTWWGIKTPRVAVLALNPHAGENGLFGTEEVRVIAPAIAALRRSFKNKAEISGPHPADTLFATHLEDFDAVVCMYHDQGLIPVKLLDFKNTVNITLGLPIIRTSVDHGTGFDIAWTNQADPSSMKSALKLAYRIARETR